MCRRTTHRRRCDCCPGKQAAGIEPQITQKTQMQANRRWIMRGRDYPQPELIPDVRMIDSPPIPTSSCRRRPASTTHMRCPPSSGNSLISSPSLPCPVAAIECLNGTTAYGLGDGAGVKSRSPLAGARSAGLEAGTVTQAKSLVSFGSDRSCMQVRSAPSSRSWRGGTPSGHDGSDRSKRPSPTASLNLVDRPQRRPSAAGASWQLVNQGACEADTQGSDRVRHVAL